MTVKEYEYDRELSVSVFKYKLQLSKSIARGSVRIPAAPFPPVLRVYRYGFKLNYMLQYKIDVWNEYIGYGQKGKRNRYEEYN